MNGAVNRPLMKATCCTEKNKKLKREREREREKKKEEEEEEKKMGVVLLLCIIGLPVTHLSGDRERG